MTKQHMTWLAVGILVGVVFSPQVRRLPLLNKLPSV